jgi:hypothetical protein
MQPYGQCGEDCRRVGAAVATECLVHMLEAALDGHAMAGKQGELGRPVRQAFQSGKPVDRRYLADGVHLGVNVERRQAGGTRVEIGNALTELRPNVAE